MLIYFLKTTCAAFSSWRPAVCFHSDPALPAMELCLGARLVSEAAWSSPAPLGSFSSFAFPEGFSQRCEGAVVTLGDSGRVTMVEHFSGSLVRARM